MQKECHFIYKYAFKKIIFSLRKHSVRAVSSSLLNGF